MPPANQEILQAYRHLHRQALKAIRYSTPARHPLRTIVQNAFRHEPRNNFSARRVANTLSFLERAEKYSGYEHKILRNILYAAYWRSPRTAKVKVGPWMVGNNVLATDLRRNAYGHLDATVIMLNESMHLCLRSDPDPTEAFRAEYNAAPPSQSSPEPSFLWKKKKQSGGLRDLHDQVNTLSTD